MSPPSFETSHKRVETDNRRNYLQLAAASSKEQSRVHLEGETDVYIRLKGLH